MFVFEFYKEYKALSPTKKKFLRRAMFRRLQDYITIAALIVIIKLICWGFER